MQGVSPKGQLGTLLWVLPARGYCCLFHQVLVIFAHPPWQGLWLGGWWLGGPPGLQAFLACIAARVRAAVLDTVAERWPPLQDLLRGQAFAATSSTGRCASTALVAGVWLRVIIVLGEQPLPVTAQPSLARLPVILQARCLL